MAEGDARGASEGRRRGSDGVFGRLRPGRKEGGGEEPREESPVALSVRLNGFALDQGAVVLVLLV